MDNNGKHNGLGFVKNAGGVTLTRLEMLNWGTFDQTISILAPEGGWSLLVGENGSGKSTAVDALRTLIVPPRLLSSSYNDAARDLTDKRKADRSRFSYVRGAWSTSSRDDSTRPDVNYLRAPGTPTVLLAVFRDSASGKSSTIAQILWESNGKIEEIYAIAESDKNIKDHISGFESIRDVRTRLRINGFKVHSTYSAYAEEFRHRLAIPTEAAIEVFNQAIGVKEVGDLGRFIRQHMLRVEDLTRFIRDTLRPHYVELDQCYKAIQRAEQQIQALTPIAKCSEEIQKLVRTRGELEDLRGSCFLVFDSRRRQLLLEVESHDAARETELSANQKDLEQQLNACEIERDSLKETLARDEIEIKIKELNFYIRAATQEKDQRHNNYQMLHSSLRKLGVTSNVETADDLETAQRVAREQGQYLRDERQSIQDTRVSLEADRREAVKKCEEGARELQHLRNQKALIPSELVLLREALCSATKVPIADLPFVGELIQVKQQYANWTGAIERLARGFGITLLVPSERYDAVSRYVNGNRLVHPQNQNLGLRLEFLRVLDFPALRSASADDQRFVYGRLDFRPDNRFSGWVAANAAQRLRYVCCESVEALQREQRGITKEGLQKDHDRHIKDDRKRISDAFEYVLGWSNQAKLNAVLQAVTTTQRHIQQLEQAMRDAALAELELDQKSKSAQFILEIENFERVNFRGEQSRIEELCRQRQGLEDNATTRKNLLSGIDAVDQKIKDLKPNLYGVQGDLAIIRQKLQETRELLSRLGEKLQIHNEDEIAKIRVALLDLAIQIEPPLDDIEEAKRAAESAISGRLTKISESVNDNEKKIEKEMAKFLKDYPEERKELTDELSCTPGFVALLQRIQGEELPTHQKRFEEFLSTNLIGNIATLSARLDEQDKEICAEIQHINAALRDIEFSAGTYIEITAVPNRSEEINEFKGQLVACLARSINPPAEERPRIFAAIKKLMDGFAQDEQWMRRVTDVRNWHEFAVKVRSKSDEREIEFLDKSSGKSGGQKARLAFAILAAAIAAQYRLLDATRSSFRFVVIDEVFARTDEENSQRALQLFQKLGLQLLVVAPWDSKSRIVEDYVQSYHLATNPTERRSYLRRASKKEYESLGTESYFHVAAAANS